MINYSDHFIYMQHAFVASQLSDDPRTHVGAVLVSSGGEILSTGANRLPNRISYTEDRVSPSNKGFWMNHAEMDAILRSKKDLTGSMVVLIFEHNLIK